MAEEIFDANDPQMVKGRKAKEKRLEQRQQNDLRSVLSTQDGQRFVWRVLSFCGIHQDSFHTNALQMANTEGKRKVGLFLESEIARACPEKFLEMQLLAAKEEANG